MLNLGVLGLGVLGLGVLVLDVWIGHECVYDGVCGDLNWLQARKLHTGVAFVFVDANIRSLIYLGCCCCARM